MKTRDVDVAIIGAGSAGLNARHECEKAGASYVLIESGPYGTTCARVGCMPSKLLIAAAERAHEIGGSGMFGIDVKEWRVDGKAVMERVRRERDRFVGFVVESTEAIEVEKRLRGHARFVGPTTLEVDDHTRVKAKSVVIATGSRPWVPSQLSGLGDEVMVMVTDIDPAGKIRLSRQAVLEGWTLDEAQSKDRPRSGGGGRPGGRGGA